MTSQTNWLLVSVVLTVGMLVLFFYSYFISVELKVLRNKINSFYIRYLNKKAEKLLYELYEAFKKLPAYFQWSDDVRDSFNREVGKAFNNGANMTYGIESKHAQRGIDIVRSYFDALPSGVRLNDVDQARICMCFETIKSLQNTENIIVMLRYIAREDSVFEQECKDCSNIIEDLHHLVH